MPKFSPRGVVSFPNVFKPRSPAPGAAERYSVNLIFDKKAQDSAEYKEMKKEAFAAAKEKWGEKAEDLIKRGKVRMPFRDAGEKEYNGYNVGDIFVNFWSNSAPGVVDGKLQDVMPSDLFAGCVARVTYNAFAYDVSGNLGVSFGLNNMQITEFDEKKRLDGRAAASSEFDSLDDEGSSSSVKELEDDDLPF